MGESAAWLEAEDPALAGWHPLPVVGALRRALAWTIDIVMVAVGLIVLSLVFSSYFAQIGPYGRIWGYAIAVIYFTYFTSSLGRGQTPGKRFVKLQVTDRHGHPLSFPRALLRSALICLIFFGNVLTFPPFLASLPLLYGTVALLGGGFFAAAYGMFLNEDTRQGPHDLVVGSYVVQAERDPQLAYRAAKSPAYHALVMIGMVVAVGIGMATLGSLVIEYVPRVEGILNLMRAINEDDRFVASSATINISPAGEHLSVEVWYLGDFPADGGKALRDEIATLVEHEYFIKRGKEPTLLIVYIYRAVDLGGFAIRLETSFDFYNRPWP